MSDQETRSDQGGLRLSVGRALDNDIVVPDRRVSRYHLEVHQQGDSWTVEDLGSGHGTELNGQPVQVADASVGDVLRIGSTWLRLSRAGIELMDQSSSETSGSATLARSLAGASSGPRYRPGDVVNGHRLSENGTRWEPIHAPQAGQHGSPGNGDGSATASPSRLGLKVFGGIAGVALTLVAAAGLASAAASADDTDTRSATRDTEPSGARSDVQERIDAAAERDRQRAESPGTAPARDRPDTPDLRSQAWDLWDDLTLNEKDLACNVYYSEGPAMVRIALTSSGYDDDVVRDLLGMMDGELCEPVYYEYEYEYVPPVPSGPSTGGALPPPPPPAWSGPNFSPTYPSTPAPLSSDNFGW